MKNSNNKILTVAVILLLVTNIALVVFMMKGKKRQESKSTKGDPVEMMVKELNMTTAQEEEYKQLKEAHFKYIKPVIDSARAAKTAFFALVKDSTVSDSVVSAYGQRIYQRQATVDSLTFAHLRKVRNIFTAEQKPGFDQFIQKMMQRGRKDSAARKK